MASRDRKEAVNALRSLAVAARQTNLISHPRFDATRLMNMSFLIVAACGHDDTRPHPLAQMEFGSKHKGDRGRLFSTLLLTHNLLYVASAPIVAGYGNDHPPTHPLARLDLVTQLWG